MTIITSVLKVLSVNEVHPVFLHNTLLIYSVIYTPTVYSSVIQNYMQIDVVVFFTATS